MSTTPTVDAETGIDELRRTHLKQLEAEAIHIMREVVAQFERPVMLYSIGKDSSVMLHLARKAFHPGNLPFPLLHIDTTWKFGEMIRFRNRIAEELGLEMRVHTNPRVPEEGINPFDHGSQNYTDIAKTDALKQALTQGRYDAAFGGARRDEEKSRAKERVFSFRDEKHRWDPKNQRPELWSLYNGRVNKGESIRVFPLSNWTELDIWQYIYLEDIEIVPLYYSAERPVVERDGTLIMVDDERFRFHEGEEPEMRPVRFRTLGCYPLTGAVQSTADTLPKIIQEMLLATNSEREGRVIDYEGQGSMEDKKREGYFSMSHQSDLIATDIEAYLAEHEDKDLLRFLTCGSVDDGKSTLIGRLLHDSHMIYEDQLEAVKADSTTQGSTDGDLDLSLLMDGLKAEREQGITIDVAYRYFSTKRRKFIIADTPGHVQYTRNMVTGASTAQLAVVMVDARNGVLPQTKRHSTIAHLLGIRHVVVAINKMDLVDWSQDTFDRIRKEYEVFTEELGANFEAYFLPMSALTGANVVNQAHEMPWFEGPPLMEHLETVDVAADRDYEHFRLPVQLVSRPNLDFRGFQGTIASGVLHPGDAVTVLPSGVSSTVERIVTFDGDVAAAGPGDAVTVTLADEIDVSRGDVLVHDPGSMQRAHKVDAMLVWMAETPMRTGQSYLLQSTAGRSNASVPHIRYQLDMDTLEREEPDRLELNSIARVGIEVDRELLFDPYEENRTTGSFILIDRLTNATVGAGMIIGRSSTWDQEAIKTLTRAVSLVTPEERATRYAQQPATILLTGLTGAGKSTIAKALERRLFDSGRITVRLDGQNVRQGVSRDLGFTAPERSENVRRVAEVGRLLNDQGIIAIAAMLAPDARDRERAKDAVGAHRFIEVHVDTPVEVCRERDPGGLYSALENGAVIDLPGVTSDYEAPPTPDLVTTDWDRTADEAAEEIVDLMRERGMLRGGRPAPADDPEGGEVDTTRNDTDGDPDSARPGDA